MLNTLKRKLVTLATPTSLVAATAVTSPFLGTVSHSDVLNYYAWVDASQVTAPVPGQFYVIAEDGEIGESLCSLEQADFAPIKHRGDGVRFVNLLGEALPEALRARSASVERTVERHSVPLSHILHHNRRILEERDLEALEKEQDAAALAEARRLEQCAEAIVTRLRQGSNVCQLTEVAIDVTSGDPLGVDFATLCLASADDPEPRRLPDVRSYPLWTEVKDGLGLIDIQCPRETTTAARGHGV
jgi:hypothetical protein